MRQLRHDAWSMRSSERTIPLGDVTFIELHLTCTFNVLCLHSRTYTDIHESQILWESVLQCDVTLVVVAYDAPLKRVCACALSPPSFAVVVVCSLATFLIHFCESRIDFRREDVLCLHVYCQLCQRLAMEG